MVQIKKADFAADRLKNILIKDKVKAQQGFIDVLKGDLFRLLNDYFELSSDIYVDLELSDRGDFGVYVSVKANRIKPFVTT